MNTRLLPCVHPDTGFSVAAQFRFLDDEAALAAAMKELEQENPVVALWIENWAKRENRPLGQASKEVQDDAKILAALVYKLLQSQADANQLARLTAWGV